MSKWQKVLLCWGVLALAAAEYIRHVQLSDKAQMVVGGAEVVLAIATGIAFGIATISKRANSSPPGKAKD